MDHTYPNKPGPEIGKGQDPDRYGKSHRGCTAGAPLGILREESTLRSYYYYCEASTHGSSWIFIS